MAPMAKMGLIIRKQISRHKSLSPSNCDIAINGKYAAVFYGRSMSNGHQSSQAIIIDTDTMTAVLMEISPHPHTMPCFSFIFPILLHRECFRGKMVLYLSARGIAIRELSLWMTCDMTNKEKITTEIFHFGGNKNALKKYDMGQLNNLHAHLGDISVLPDGRVSLAATSAKSLGEAALNENEQLFIQVLDPSKDLTKAAAYSTTGTRTGLGGPDNDKTVTDYGVAWLTNYSDKEIRYPQAVSDEKGNTIILYELYDYFEYNGVYSMIVDPSGKVIQNSKCIARGALLGRYETPIYRNGTVYWTSFLSKIGDAKDKNLCVFCYQPYAAGEDIDSTAVTPIDFTEISRFRTRPIQERT